MSTTPICITLENKTIERIEKARGLAKRSTFIDSILSDYLNISEKKNEGSVSMTTLDSKIVSRSAKKGDIK